MEHESRSQKTDFASAQRSTASEISDQNKLLSGMTDVIYMIDLMPVVVLILNENRQIIRANKAAVRLFQAEDMNSLLGQRSGEAIGCCHAFSNEGGCGTTVFCSTCGCVKALISSFDHDEGCEDCQLLLGNGDALNMRVYAYRKTFDNNVFIFTIMLDISSEKRLNTFQRVFFHDIMNTLGSLRLQAELLNEITDPQKLEKTRSSIYRLCNRAIDQVSYRMDIIKAENFELRINPTTIISLELLQDIKETFEQYASNMGCDIVIDSDAEQIEFTSDKTQLTRVVSNTLINAIEALIGSSQSKTVRLGCNVRGEQVEFYVHNQGFIPNEVQLQIFKRSFSTKDSYRGMGTYSMKLLSERYLKGSISFTSSEEYGTTFTARYPLKLI